MQNIAIEIVIIVLLLVGNGIFAMTEMAVVSARRARLKAWAEAGDQRAAEALELAASPNRFLSTVQVGISLVGVLAGAFGGATLAGELSRIMSGWPVLAPFASWLGVAVVVVGITYFSLIIGELVPKRLALGNPEAIARLMARPMNAIATMARPLVWFLGVSTDGVLKILGIRETPAQRVTDDEVRSLMEEGRLAGTFHPQEPRMVERVLALDQLPVREIMTPRARVIFIAHDDPRHVVWRKIVASGHSSFPIYEGTRDQVIGIVSVKSLYANDVAGEPASLKDLMTPALIVPESQPVSRLLDQFKTSGKHAALVTNEFGGIVGIVTLVDMLEAIVGDIRPSMELNLPQARQRADGSWLVDAGMEVTQLAQTVAGLDFPPESRRDYETLAGFVIEQLGRVPAESDAFEAAGHRFEVIDMDQHRVDKVLVTPVTGAGQPPVESGQDSR